MNKLEIGDGLAISGGASRSVPNGGAQALDYGVRGGLIVGLDVVPSNSGICTLEKVDYLLSLP